jgi:2-oxoglutarate dehydrogenase E2 component (dihydrolipoamide succinyltransferase)
MSSNITVPELGESVLEATVGHWRKKEGDRVSPGEVVVELETDKVDLEVGAERDGVLAKIEKKEGEDVRIGDVLGVIEDAPSAAKDGDGAPRGQAVPTRTDESLPARAEGARKPSIGPSPSEKPQAGASGTFGGSTAPPRRTAEEISTPSARRFARAQGLNLGEIPVSGASPPVTRKALESLATSHVSGGAAPETAPPRERPARSTPTVAPGPKAVALEREERVRMSRRRLTIAQRLVEAQQTAAILTTFNEVNMSAVAALRKRQREAFKERYGVGLGVVSFFVKAAIAALKQFPRLNAEVQGNEIVLKHYYDIGVAVGASEGLVVPVLRDADQMTFAEIETAVKEFARKAHEGSLTLDELRGGTFSVSNGGVFGSLLSTPILNPPQVGILGLHKIEERPVADEGQVVLRPMMYVALSYDHRIVDGMEAVQFLVRVKELVEDPGTLLIES